MSHLRDLQKLRNTRHNFQIKRNTNPINEMKLVELRNNRLQEATHEESYSKYLQSKEIFTSRQSREKQLVRPGDRPKLHKRGESFGIGSTHYESRSNDPQLSGLSVYNFSLKLGNTQVSRNSPSLSRKKNSIAVRHEKVPDLIITHEKNEKNPGSPLRKPLKLNLSEKEPSVNKNSFQILYPVGKGGFGKVWKVKCKKTHQIYAMKEMQKAKIINKKSIDSVMNERALVAELNHPFLVNMKTSFQDRENLYLVMDYLNGGDLRYHIGCKGRFSQAETKFFIANIIVGLEYLHNRNIIHRDLKPENFVFDSSGYLRITDLGVSRVVREDNSQDTSGTPGYMAPEVICHKNHSFAADYFALGVLGYEFMMGRRPYNGRNRKQIREHILSKQAEIKIDELPYRWSPKAADFINKLLIRSPEKRLGWKGINELKQHPWLEDVDWKSIRDKTVISPFIPLSIEENYDDYKEQISEDTIDENAEETRMMLRDREVQSLFQGYEVEESKVLHTRKKSLRETNNTDSEQISLRGSGR